ncbi:hypothetical protein KKE60_05775 [Patescibacteria group bacterium]|nr:hypothetical protein [Patescibacteria group bacterium]
MGFKDEETCSICGTKHPHIEMHLNAQFEEARCKPCFERYGDVPLETLSAALARFDLNIIDIPREDLDVLVSLQKKKITLNRETEQKMIDKANALWVFGGRENKIKDIQEKAKVKRDRINAEIDGIIKEIKEKQGR